MPTQQIEFSESAIDAIRHELIETENEFGKTEDFSVEVNHRTVIHRTNDIDRFESFRRFITPRTWSVVFRIYFGNSNNARRWFLTFPRPSSTAPAFDPPAENLNGMDKEEEYAQRLAQHEKQKRLDYLEGHSAKLESENETQRRRIELLEAEIEQKEKDFQSNKYKISRIDLGELGGLALESLIRKNTHLIRRLPIGETLAGVLDADAPPFPQSVPVHAAPRRSVRIGAAGSPETPPPAAPQPANRYEAGALEILRNAPDEETRFRLVLVLNHCADHPEHFRQWSAIAAQSFQHQ